MKKLPLYRWITKRIRIRIDQYCKCFCKKYKETNPGAVVDELNLLEGKRSLHLTVTRLPQK